MDVDKFVSAVDGMIYSIGDTPEEGHEWGRDFLIKVRTIITEQQKVIEHYENGGGEI